MTRDLESTGLPDADCPDTYFTSGYGKASALTRGGLWRCLRWDDAIVLPYIVNAVGAETYDAASPYGYSGVYVAPGCGAGDLSRFWKLVTEAWRDRRIVAMFFRFSPLDLDSLRAVASLDEVALTRRGDTIGVDVSRGTEEVWNGLKSSCRYMIRKALKAGFTARVRPAELADLRADAAFRALYEQTMKRVGSAPGYLFRDEYYAALLGGLGTGLMIAEVADPAGEIVAASLVFAHRDRVHYHLAGSAGIQAGSNNLLLWTILSWAADSGYRWVHLGGGVRPGDNLFWFKESFGGQRLQFWTGAVVLDDAAYKRLVLEHAAATATSVTALGESGFFPAYRFGRGLI